MEKVMSGNETAAYISYAFTEIASLFPITPSSPMAEKVEQWSSEGQVNLFGTTVQTIQMESETGSAGVLHGALKSGALATTYTCSQGLLLMIPALYKMVGELLPGVLHVSARTVATSGLSIYGDHSDVMAIRQTGTVMLASGNVQEVGLFAAVAHMAAVELRLPVLHFFDGFETSHEVRKIQVPSYQALRKVYNEQGLVDFRNDCLSNFNPKVTGGSFMPDLFFQQRESINGLYNQAETVIESLIQQLNPLFGILSSSVEYFGTRDAERIIVIMGSAQETVKAVVESLHQKGEKVGLLVIHVYRPFPKKIFLERLPEKVKEICVMDRTKEPGASGEPLLLDVQHVCTQADRPVRIIGCRYGIGGKDVTPEQIRGIFKNMATWPREKSGVIGITDDATCLTIPQEEIEDPFAGTEIIAFGFGSDGSTSGIREITKVIGHLTDYDVQNIVHYSPVKSRNLTVSTLRIHSKSIKAAYPVKSGDVVMATQSSYLNRIELISSIKQKGKLLVNYSGDSNMLKKTISNESLALLQEKEAEIYLIPASNLARKYELGPKINCLMMTAFLKLTDYIPFDEGLAYYKQLLKRNEFMKNVDYCYATYQAMEDILSQIKQFKWTAEKVTPQKKELVYSDTTRKPYHYFLNEVTTKEMVDNHLQGGDFSPLTQPGKQFVESQGIPCWQKDQCIGCKKCQIICPHNAIHISTSQIKQGEKEFELIIDPDRCTGCHLCVDTCPVQGKALHLINCSPVELKEKRNAFRLKKEQIVKTESDYFDPRGACAGCGETPYLHMLTELFGERLNLVNATGCSSIWGGSVPFSAYKKNEKGHGPTWSSSLFENNSAFGLGIHAGYQKIREESYQLLKSIIKDENTPLNVRNLCQEVMKDKGYHIDLIEELMSAISDTLDPALQQLQAQRQFLLKRSQWLVGGDGWAYDIDFNGIDHLISRNENVNILILDNGGYANTGGQASKSSGKGTKMKFASAGNPLARKDLSLFAMMYEHAYVAQVSIFADPYQTQKTIKEAERYEGVSIIFAYSHCVIHKTEVSGIENSRAAVNSGYWPLFRYRPHKKKRFVRDHCTFSEEALNKYLAGDPRFEIIRHSDLKAELLLEIMKRNRNYLILEQLVNEAEVN
ncbi:pyruvate:ferredoxin (flavodoxin) oxidoreductase [Niallia hominis]|uniref:Pyruvate:ferredoxin (Flavodoxin) oxidoreductase n=1 Tax=Niallia hominis TaxID=3133173 RepID=A0ABV1F0G9_9BACI